MINSKYYLFNGFKASFLMGFLCESVYSAKYTLNITNLML
ncbi:hypothetical protein [uncultured Gammaproteobacteria bacterium]|nr:hypothetical protein [uncultured Gammaproteobacteria bacterium]